MKQIFLCLLILFSFSKANNSLKYEDSPYLLQHSQNPVNWYAWNKSSLEFAKKEDKLIFVSIGYSTCHWCHVMREESFEDIEIAKDLNNDYISIKIDREELPHVDNFYQESFKKLTNKRNGWPLNFILTPKKELVYISTYIPNDLKYDTEGMKTLIPRIAKEYKAGLLNKKIEENQKLLNKKIEKMSIKNSSIIVDYIESMEKRFDKTNKGFDKENKFPLVMHLNLLYDLSLLKENSLNSKPFFMFSETMSSMSYSGMYDHIDGGFYRYAVNSDWTIPHFEKMLYTQAELLPLYYKLYRKTNEYRYKKLIIQSIEFLKKNFQNDMGLYYSASDADSKNNSGLKQEGYYYTYDYDEVNKLLLKEKIDNSEEILEYLGFDDFGNFEEELNNVFINKNFNKPQNLEKAYTILREIRSKKHKPFIDKKIITSWNALMIKAMFEVSLLDKTYKSEAINSLDSLLEELYIDGVLYHQKIKNKKVKQKALLEDYSFLIDLLLTSYQTTYNKKYLDLSKELIDKSFVKFYKDGIWYLDETKEYEAGFNDKYYVSAISRMFHNLLGYSNLVYDLDMLEESKKMILSYKSKILNSLDNSPEAIRTLVRVEKGDIIIKSNRTNLIGKQREIESINYPFLLRNIEETKNYLACDEKSCFAYDMSLKKLIKKIEK